MAARNPFASSIPDIYDAYAPYSYQRRVLSTGYYFVRNLLIVGALCGGFVALYRNDVLRDLSRRVGQEPRYLALEKLWVGTPGWGTPRSMEPVLADGSVETAPAVEAPVAVAPAADPPAAPAAAPISPPPVEPAAQPAPIIANTPAPAPVAVAPAPVAAAPAPVAAAPIDPLAPVSLESLPLLGHESAPNRAVSFADLAPARAAAPAPRSAAPAPAPVAAHRAPAAARPNGKAIKVTLEETPAPAAAGRSIPAPSRHAPPPEPEPAPVAAKPAPPPPGPKATEARQNDNPLLAAVRGAVRARPPKESVPAAQ